MIHVAFAISFPWFIIGDEDYDVLLEQQETNKIDAAATNDEIKPECQYGTSCYRQNPQHRRDFKHTQPPAQISTSPDERNSNDKPGFAIFFSF